MQEFGTRIWAGTLLLQCIWLARGIAFCCRTFGTSSEQILEARLRAQKWWAVICPQMDHRLIEKVDAAKCRMTRLVWILLTAGSMFRLTLQQLMLAIGRERISPHFDLQLFSFATVGLVVSLKPNLITPRSLDVFYVATSLLSILALLPASNIMDAREFMSLHKSGVFLSSPDQVCLALCLQHIRAFPLCHEIDAPSCRLRDACESTVHCSLFSALFCGHYCYPKGDHLQHQIEDGSDGKIS